MNKVAKFVTALLVAVPLFLSPIQETSAAKKDENIIDYAHSLIGIPYKYGGTTPSGFDCSGFISYVFNEYGVDLPRRSADQYASGTAVNKADLLPGDLVFFNTSGSGISHVGMYVGEDQFIHSESGTGIAVDDLNDRYYKSRYVGSKRYLDPQTVISSVEIKDGQVGTVYIKKKINLWERNADGKLVLVRVLQPGEHYRVYGYDKQYSGQYNLGSQLYVTNMPEYLDYQSVEK